MKLKPIKDKKKIATIFEKGRVINGKNISIRVYRFKGVDQGDVISVPKKNFPLAVNRNLLKRRLRSVIGKVSFPKNGVSFFLIYFSIKIVETKRLRQDLENLVATIS